MPPEIFLPSRQPILTALFSHPEDGSGQFLPRPPVRSRKAATRVYFRRGKGKRIALPTDVGSEDFAMAYAAALAGEVPQHATQRREPAKPGTLAALVESYMRSASYKGLRETTRAGYSSRIETLRTKHGHRTVSGLTRERIVTGILAPYADKPGAALATLKMLRVLIRHAIEIGWLRDDPSRGIRRPKTGEIRAWKEGEIEAFEMRW